MKNLILAAATLLLSSSVYTQDLEAVRKSDTLYVYFDAGKGQEKFYNLTKAGPDLQNPLYYFFIGDKGT